MLLVCVFFDIVDVVYVSSVSYCVRVWIRTFWKFEIWRLNAWMFECWTFDMLKVRAFERVNVCSLNVWSLYVRSLNVTPRCSFMVFILFVAVVSFGCMFIVFVLFALFFTVWSLKFERLTMWSLAFEMLKFEVWTFERLTCWRLIVWRVQTLRSNVWSLLHDAVLSFIFFMLFSCVSIVLVLLYVCALLYAAMFFINNRHAALFVLHA